MYSLTGKADRAVFWKRWAAAIRCRRGLLQGEIEALHDLALNANTAGRYSEGLEAIVKAQRLAAGSLLEPLRLALVEGKIRRDMGDIQGALTVADRGLAELKGLANSGLYADYLSFRAMVVGTILHEDEQALKLNDQALRVAKDLGDKTREFMFTYNKATYLARLRRYSDAQPWLERALELAEPVSSRVMAMGGIAGIHRLQGRLDEAAEWYQKALALQDKSHVVSTGLNARLGMVLVQLAKGDITEARRHADIAIAADARTDAFVRSVRLVAGKAYEQDDPRTAYGHLVWGSGRCRLRIEPDGAPFRRRGPQRPGCLSLSCSLRACDRSTGATPAARRVEPLVLQVVVHARPVRCEARF